MEILYAEVELAGEEAFLAVFILLTPWCQN
jgi:hypothetical protein